MEKRFKATDSDYLSILDDDDFAFPGRSFTITWGIDLVGLSSDRLVQTVRSERGNFQHFEVVRRG